MTYRGFEICCPLCKGDLQHHHRHAEQFICLKCDKEYPILHGIPDFRVFPDPYIDIEQDREKGGRVAEKFDEYDFSGLIEFYYSMTSVVPPQHARQYSRGLLAAQARAETTLGHWENVLGHGRFSQSEPALEIGCGTGPFLLVGSKKFSQLVGVDIAFRWLILCQKRLAEAGLTIPLICACAEALPFPDRLFGTVIADSVVEHLQNQQTALQEVNRVLHHGGWFCVTTPNRYSLGPDPHAGLWLGGIIPEAWVGYYVRAKGGIAPKRNLLSVYGLQRILQGAGFAAPVLLLPDISDSQRLYFGKGLRLLIDMYRMMARWPLTSWLLYTIGPFFHALTQKPGFSSTPPREVPRT